MAAGKSIDLDMQGDGLVEVKITEAALKAQIKNSGVIQADGGQVVMTAKAAGELLNTVINSDGIVQARGLEKETVKFSCRAGIMAWCKLAEHLMPAGRQPVAIFHTLKAATYRAAISP